MQVVERPAAMTALSESQRMRGRSVGLVPTMGALHEGHLSLVRRSRQENDVTVVSIFVNPAQFGPGEDFDRYPRDTEGDIAKLEKAGADVVFLPGVKDIYPDDFHTYVTVEGVSDSLCGAFRPGHFRGVATVVAKLFHIVRPLRSYFGQKDYQQTVVIRTMVRDLDMGIGIIVCPIVREPDGLAMSSRNAYLSSAERRAAGIIHRALEEIAGRLKREAPFDIRKEFGKILTSEPLVKEIQYASAYDPETLRELDFAAMGAAVLLAVAIRIGTTRLIDNMMVDR